MNRAHHHHDLEVEKESGASWGWKRRSPVLRDPSKCLNFARRLMGYNEKAFRFKMMWIILNYEYAETGLREACWRTYSCIVQQDSPMLNMAVELLKCGWCSWDAIFYFILKIKIKKLEQVKICFKYFLSRLTCPLRCWKFAIWIELCCKEKRYDGFWIHIVKKYFQWVLKSYFRYTD